MAKKKRNRSVSGSSRKRHVVKTHEDMSEYTAKVKNSPGQGDTHNAFDTAQGHYHSNVAPSPAAPLVHADSDRHRIVPEPTSPQKGWGARLLSWISPLLSVSAFASVIFVSGMYIKTVENNTNEISNLRSQSRSVEASVISIRTRLARAEERLTPLVGMDKELIRCQSEVKSLKDNVTQAATLSGVLRQNAIKELDHRLVILETQIESLYSAKLNDNR